MKYLLYVAILLSVLLLPCDGTDVGKLRPIEVVAISETDGLVAINTDTGDRGIGETLDAAIEDMKAAASGIIYLDTAEYLLLEKGMETHLNAMEGHIKKGIHLSYATEKLPLEGIADFLSVHRPNVKLGTVTDYGSIPTITEEMGRYRLLEK